MLNADFLKVSFVRLGSFTIGVADRISRKFAFTANAANFAHIFILRLKRCLFNTEYFIILAKKKQVFLIVFNKNFVRKRVISKKILINSLKGLQNRFKYCKI